MERNLVTDSQTMLKTLAGGDQKINVTDEPVRIDGPTWSLMCCVRIGIFLLKFNKGHQDAPTPYAQLPLTARLSAIANAVVGIYQDRHGQDRPI